MNIRGEILHHKAIWIIDTIILILIFAFFLTYFEPRHLFSKTTTTGGDTASHYYTAQYLKDYLLPKGNITGWLQGNYAGFPLFQLYFPLPFILMVFLSYFIPLEIAFKIITVSGIFLLPLCTYFMFRFLRYSFPTPIIGSIFTLPFLFMEANRMWGGNIPSTVAGEFSFSLSLALCVLYFGTMYKGIFNHKFAITNGILLFFISFSHGCTLILAATSPLFFLVTTNNFLKKLRYILKVYTIGFLLLGFWIIPLLLNSDYTTYYNFKFKIDSISQFMPLIITPFVFFGMVYIFLVLAHKINSHIGISPPEHAEQAGLMKRMLQRFIAPACLINTTGSPKQELNLYDHHGTAKHEKEFWNPPEREAACSRKESIPLLNGEGYKLLYFIFVIIVSLVFYFMAYSINVIDIRFLPFIQLFLLFIGAVGFSGVLSHLKFQWLIPFLLLLGTILWVNYNVTYIKDWIRWNYTGFEGKKSWKNFREINEYLSGSLNDPRVVYEHSVYNRKFGTIRAFESLPLFSGRSTLEGIYMQSSISSPFVFYIQSEISEICSCPLPEYNCTSLNIKNAITHLKMFNVRDIIIRSKKAKTDIRHNREFKLKKKFGKYNIYELTNNQNIYVTPLRYKPIQFSKENWKRVSYNWFKNKSANNVHLVFIDDPGKKEKERFETSQGKGLNKLPRIPVQSSGHIKEKISEEEILIDIDARYIGKPLLVKISYHPNWKAQGADKIYLASPSFMLIYPNRTNVRLYYGKTIANYAGNFLTVIGVFVLFLNIPIINRRKMFHQRISHIKNIMNTLHTQLLRQSLYGNTIRGISKFNSFVYPVRIFLSNGINRNSKGILSTIMIVLAAFVFFLILFMGIDDASTLKRKGMKYFEQTEYDKAIAAFNSLLDKYPDFAVADDACFFKAKCYFKTKEYAKSTVEFQKLIRLYPESKWVPEAHYHIGLNEVKLGNVEEAKRAFTDIILKFRRSSWAQHARKQLSKIFKKKYEGTSS